jgi:hypothetical protein
VIPPTLEYLGQEPLDATTGAGDRRVEEDQARLLPGGAGRDAYDLPPVAGDRLGRLARPSEVTISYPRDRAVQSTFCSGSLKNLSVLFVLWRNLVRVRPSNLAE